MGLVKDVEVEEPQLGADLLQIHPVAGSCLSKLGRESTYCTPGVEHDEPEVAGQVLGGHVRGAADEDRQEPQIRVGGLERGLVGGPLACRADGAELGRGACPSLISGRRVAT